MVLHKILNHSNIPVKFAPVEVRIPVKFAQNYEKIWIQLLSQFIGIYSKSNVTTCHKNVKHETL